MEVFHLKKFFHQLLFLNQNKYMLHTALEIHSLEVIDDIAKKFIDTYPDTRIFAFYGEMGVGKTTFIKALCKILGADIGTKSPTFSIVNAYPTPEGEIYHFDCYRIENISEFIDIGYEEYFNSGSYCFIEWAEKIQPLLTDDTVRVQMNINMHNNSRIIQIN